MLHKTLLRSLSVLLAAGLLASACSETATSDNEASTESTAEAVVAETPAEDTSGDALTLGVIHSLTGGSAPFGNASKKGVDLAITSINSEGGVNGQDIQVIESDDQTDEEEAINIVNGLITQDEVDAILGPTSSAATSLTGPIANEAQVPMMNAAGAAPGIAEIGDYVWRNTLGDARLVPYVVETLGEQLGIERAVLLFGADEAFTQSVAEEFEAAAEANGIELLESISFASTDQDFSAQLTAANTLDPDALFVSAIPSGGAGILTAAADQGIDLPIIGGSGFNSPEMIEIAGSAAEGVYSGAAWVATSPNELSQEFVAAYQDTYNEAPDQFAAQGYAAVHIFAAAAEQGGATREGVQEGLGQISNLPTVLGEFNFTDVGDGDYNALILQVVDGDYTVVDE